jgi:serine/threonine protein kinase
MTGQTISHYRVLQKLGEGGMGVVYKAEDLNLHRTVALKFLRTDTLGDQHLHGRFWKEAEAAAALDHPNIPTVHEISEVDGQTFIAMAFVEGESLTEKIKRRPLPLDEALGVAIQVGEALQVAHECGIVHRDIKPANIMITPDDRVKVMDFGLAHLAGQTRITKTGTIMGTPAYMSPEQARGDGVDHRSDIWSLGVVLYEMVTGKLPFRGDTDHSILRAILDDQPEPMTADQNAEWWLWRLPFATGEPERLFQVPGQPFVGLSISPDGQDVLFTQRSPTAADLMLVENFR